MLKPKTTTSKKALKVIFSLGSNFIYLGYAAIYFDKEEQNWISAKNDTCLSNPLLHAKSIFATALAQLQLFRFTFKYLPQQFISFNHEAWAYPLGASVPATAFILQFLIFFYNRTICDQLPLGYFLKKLNLPTESTPVVTRFQVTTIMLMFIGLIEILIQIKKQLKTLKSWIRKRNRIAHAAPVNPNPPLAIQCNRSQLMNPTMAPIDLDNFATANGASSSISGGQHNSDLDDRLPSSNINSSSPSQFVISYYFAELTIFVIVIFLVNFWYTYIFGYGNVTVYIAIVINDFLCFALPTAVVLSSDKILGFIKHKLTQLNLQ